MDHIADGDALKRYRGSILEASGIFKVGAEHDLAANKPPVEPDMTMMAATRTAMATRTSAPTLSCDHLISFRLGT